jgi:hypothetical protein
MVDGWSANRKQSQAPFGHDSASLTISGHAVRRMCPSLWELAHYAPDFPIIDHHWNSKGRTEYVTSVIGKGLESLTEFQQMCLPPREMERCVQRL